MNIFRRGLHRLLPTDLVYGDHLTRGGRRLVVGTLAGLGTVALVVAGVILSGVDQWPTLLGGAILGAAPGLFVWAVNHYREDHEEVGRELRKTAEFDLLHARLNLMAHQMGLPMVGLNSYVEDVLRVRTERLAHLGGLDEHRPTLEPNAAGWTFWTDTAMGRADDPRGPGLHPFDPRYNG